MKLASVEAMFPELKGGAIYQAARGKANSTRTAIARAFATLLKLPAVRGKRIRTIKCMITVVDIKAEAANEAN